MVRLDPGEDGLIAVSQARFSVLGSGIEQGSSWRVPITLRYADAVGYLVWSQPEPELRALIQGSSEHLSATERVALMSNLSLVMSSGDIDAGASLGLIGGFADDPDAEVIRSVMGAQQTVGEWWIPDELEPPFAAYERETLSPALERIGLEKRAGESESVTRLRPNLMTWLAVRGQDEAVSGLASELSEAFLANPRSVRPAEASFALSVVAQQADVAFQSLLVEKLRETDVPEHRDLYLDAIASVPGEPARDAALSLSMEDGLAYHEREQVWWTVRDQEENRDAILQWAISNFEALSEILPPQDVGKLGWLGGGCSEQRFEQAREFFGAPERAARGTERVLAEVEEEVRRCLVAKERHGPSVQEFLEGASAR